MDPKALIRMDAVENSNRANVAKLEQLVKDARAKVLEAEVTAAHRFGREKEEQERRRLYWKGFESGLGRAINVLEGRG